MKILFMRPPAPNILKHLQILNSEPLELEYLHTVAQQHGWDDMIYDGFNNKKNAREIMKTFQPDVVAITGYITQEKLMLKYAKTAKEINPNIITVIGGVHAQLNYERLYSPDVDYVFRSEDVNAFGNLLDFFAGNSLDLSTISGLCWRENGSWIRRWLKLDSFISLWDWKPSPTGNLKATINKYPLM